MIEIIAGTLIFLFMVNSCMEESDRLFVDLIERNQLDSAAQVYRTQIKTNSEELSMDALSVLSAEFYKKGNHTASFFLSRLNLISNPDSIRPIIDLAKLHLVAGSKDSSRYYISIAEKIDPFRLSTVLLRKRIFFVPAEFKVPPSCETPHFYTRPISGADAELDHPAVMSSIEHIKSVLGSHSWPTPGLTLEEDRADLIGHEGEMERGEAFVYTVMNPAQTEIIGCIYIFPSRWDDHDAEISMWTTKEAFDQGLDEILYSQVKEWINQKWPFNRVVYLGREVSFSEFYQKLGKQDEKYHE